MIGKVIHNALIQDSDVSALVGARVYPIIIPEDVNNYPILTYQIQNLNSEITKGTSITLSGNVEITCYAEKYSEIQDLVQKVIKALDRNITTKTIDGQTVNSSTFENYSDGFEESKQLFEANLTFYMRKPYDNE